MNSFIKKLLVAITLFTVISTASGTFAQSFQGLSDLPGGTTGSEAWDISADGKVVVGFSNSSGPQAFRWTESGGIKGLGFLPGMDFSIATAVSADGSVITGWSNSTNTSDSSIEAFRWEEPGPMVGLGDFPGGQVNSKGWGVAANGGVIVGRGSSANTTEAFLWSFASGMTGLGHLSGDTHSGASDVWSSGGDAIIVGYSYGSYATSGVVREAFYFDAPGPMVGMGFLPNAYEKDSAAMAISGNGKVIVGWSASSVSGVDEAFRYTLPGGPMQGLGFLPAPNPKTLSYASDVSGDGSVVVGYVNASSEGVAYIAFIWDEINGMRDLKAVLSETYGLNLTGWTLGAATGISDDGLTIVGDGANPSGNSEAWIAKLAVSAPDIAVNPNAINASVAGGASTVESFTISNSGNAELTFDISGAKWEKMPGSARDIGVGDDGEAWLIGTVKIAYGYGIYRWTGTEWNGMPGAAMSIDVGSQNHIVVVNDVDDIFQWDGGNWQPLPGKARRVSIAADGTIWAIGENAAFGGFEILKWNGSSWDLMPGGAVKIGVGSKNYIWCVSEFNLIYRWNGSDWDLIPGLGSDISVGSDGEVWVVSNIATTGGNEIFRWNGTDWKKQPAGAVAIGVGSASYIWDVNDAGEIYRWSKSGLILPEWLNVSLLTGAVTPGGQKDIKVTLDAAALTPDTYFTDMFVDSNDPDEPVVQIPVTLEVQPITDVEEAHSAHTPDRFYLLQNYPNPFNSETVIAYHLPKSSFVEIAIFNLRGQRIATLLSMEQNAGSFEVKWDGRDEKGQPTVSGVYVYQFKAGKYISARKMMLLR